MKIAVLHSGDLEKVSLGGVDRYVKSLIANFGDGEITVFGTGVKGEAQPGLCEERSFGGKRYAFVPITVDFRRPLSLFYMLEELKWLRRLGAYDCIYAQRTEYSVPFLFSRHRRKLIQMIHGSSKYSEIGFGKKMAKAHLLLERIAISVAAKTLVVLNRAEFGVPYYREKYRRHADRIFFGRNMIETETFFQMDKGECRRQMGFDERESVVMFVGRVEDNPKRVLSLPDICKALNDAGVRATFVVIGEGSDKQALMEKARRYDVFDQFRFPGYIGDSAVIARYDNCADVLVNISMFEGTCTSILEALACGVPVVSTDTGDIHECLNGAENGIIIPNDEHVVQNAAAAIAEILRNPPPMNEAYRNYQGEAVASELREMMRQLGQ